MNEEELSKISYQWKITAYTKKSWVQISIGMITIAENLFKWQLQDRNAIKQFINSWGIIMCPTSFLHLHILDDDVPSLLCSFCDK